MCARFRQRHRLMLVYHGSSPSKNLGGGWAISFQTINNIENVYLLSWKIIVIKKGAKCKPHAKQNHAPVMFLSDFMFMSIQKLMQHVQHITIATPWIFGLRLSRPSLHENTPHVTRALSFKLLAEWRAENWTSAIQSSSQLKAVLRLCSGCSICNLWDLEKPTIETSKK